MPRKPRFEFEPGVWHVYARGVARRRIFIDDADRLTYLALLETVSEACEWRCLAYCLMDTHVHLLVETREPNLGRGMGRLHGRYAQTFNARHARWGHLFGDRFGAKAMADDAQLWTVLGYLALNPVEARLCAAPLDWPWSSHRAIAGSVPPPSWLNVTRLLALLDHAGGNPADRYCSLVADRAAAFERPADG